MLVGVDAPAFNALFCAAVRRRDAAQAARPHKRARVLPREGEAFPPVGACKGPPSCCGAVMKPATKPLGAGVVRVGVGVLVVQQGRPGQVLLGRRKGSHGAGLFQLPGGHLELAEGWEACGIREVEEETGLVLDRCVFAGVTNDPTPDDGKHYVTVMLAAAAPPGAEPELREPDKCEGWGWHDWAALPAPLFDPIRKLAASGFRLPDAAALAAGAGPSARLPGDCAFVLG